MYNQYTIIAVTWAVLFAFLFRVMWVNYRLTKFRREVSPGNTIRVRIGKYNELATVDIRPTMNTVHVIELNHDRRYRTSIVNVFPL